MMVALRQVEISFYRRIARQRGRGFSAFAQVFGGTAIPFSRKYIVPAARLVGAALLEFAAPEIAEVVSGRKSFATAEKNAGRQTLRKQFGSGSKESTTRRVNPSKPANWTSRSRSDILTKFYLYWRHAIFGSNLLRQFRELLKGKSQ